MVTIWRKHRSNGFETDHTDTRAQVTVSTWKEMRRANDRNSVRLYDSLGHNSTNEHVFILSETTESYYLKTEINGDWDGEVTNDSRASQEENVLQTIGNGESEIVSKSHFRSGIDFL